MSRTVVSSDGRTWTVRRRWLPRLGTETLWGRIRRRTRGAVRRARAGVDSADVVGEAAGFADDIVGAIVAVVVVVLLVAAALFIVIPLLVVLVDLVVLFALGILAVIARVALRRPWSVDAHDADGALVRWRVIGWRASGAKVDEVADLLAAGQVPPDGQVVAERREGDVDGGE